MNVFAVTTTSFSSLIPPGLLSSGQAFALLDDAHGSGAQSRLYYDLVQVLECRTAAEWLPMWQELSALLQQNYYGLSLLSYETGAQLQGIAPREEAVLSQILVFRHCLLLDQEQVSAALASAAGALPLQAGIAGLHADTDPAAFEQAIEAIHAYIEAGDSYQVNYTYRLQFDAYGSPAALYSRLRARQPVPYGALIMLPDGGAVLSLSPELFIRQHGGQLQARPMKGTAAAAADEKENAAIAAALAADSKNRAENLMIVDLLRNDLGRIAATGTVQVPQLFEVQAFSSVLQMTSTVQAQLQAGLSLADIMTALFPCGSITGAPKHRTMEIIRQLETAARGLYTGAIGWFDPASVESAALAYPGDFCLSVPSICCFSMSTAI